MKQNNNWPKDPEKMTNNERRLFHSNRHKTSELAFTMVNITQISKHKPDSNEKCYLFWTEEHGADLINFMPEVRGVQFIHDIRVNQVPQITQFPAFNLFLTSSGQATVFNYSNLSKNRYSTFIMMRAVGNFIQPEVIFIVGSVAEKGMPMTLTDPSLTITVRDAHKFKNLEDLLVHKMLNKLVGDTEQSLDDVNTAYLKKIFKWEGCEPPKEHKPVELEQEIQDLPKDTQTKIEDYFS